MADIDVTRVQLNTSTGTQDVTITGFGTPDAAIVIIQNVSADDTITSDLRLSVGATDGASNVVNYVQSADGTSTSSTDRRTAGGILGIVYNDSGTVIQQISFDSWVTDGIRINNTTASGSTFFATVILFKNVQAGAFLEQMLTTSESVSVGFEADLVFMLDTGNASTAFSSNNIFAMGIAHNDGSDTNRGLLYYDRDSQSTTTTGSYASESYSFGQYFADSLSWGGSVGSYTSTGFTLSASAAPGNDYVVGLAIKFDNAKNISLNTVNSPTATGAANFDSAGFTPDFGLYLAGKNTLVNTVQPAGVDAYSIWAVGENDYYSNAIISEDANATTTAKSLASQSKLQLMVNGSSLLHEGTFTGFDTNGFDFNFTTVNGTQRKWIELAIGDAGGGAINITGATSTYSYSPVSANIELTGSIDITGATSTYSYLSVAGAVDLTGAIDITGATSTYSYSSIAGVVELGAEINVVGATPSYSYSAIAGSVTLEGAINITGQTQSYSYTALRASVQVGELDLAVNFSGSVKQSAFSGALREQQFSGTIKQSDFSGSIKAAAFSGVRR